MRASRRACAVLLLAGSVVPGEEPRDPPQPPAVTAEPRGLQLRLAEGAARREEPPRATPSARPLAPAEAEAVLRRLPPLPADPSPSPLAVRPDSPPPPRTGRTVLAPFPAAGPSGPEPPAGAAGPLAVTRRSPEGEVPQAALLSVTFSRPMVALGADAIAPLPVRLSPEPPGAWRWVGVDTLVFEARGRFPMATLYRVEVPAGTRAVDGAATPSAVAWSFATPPPTLVAGHPRDTPVPPHAVLAATFDQDVRPADVLRSVQLVAGGRLVAVRLATADEVAGDAEAAAFLARTDPGRGVALRAAERLPPDSAVRVSLAAGLSSAEGPRVAASVQEWSFRTFGPLRVTEHRCGWQPRECPPGAPWRFTFSSPLDATAAEAAITIEPELPDHEVDLEDRTLVVRGATRPRTTYRVTLPAILRDRFGQSLGTPAPFTFHVGAAPPSLQSAAGPLAILDPDEPPRFAVHSSGHAALRVRAFAVTAEDWPAFAVFLQESWRGTGAEPPGRLVLSRELAVQGPVDTLVETSVDLSPILERGLGHLVLGIEAASPTEAAPGAAPARRRRPGRPPRPAVWAWVQATRLGLAAFADATGVLAWASRLDDGRPLQGVRLRLLGGAEVAVTDPTGVGRVALPAAAPALVASLGPDVALLPAHTWAGGTWQRREPGAEVRFAVFDDRRLYRPGEDVRLKGWLRRIGPGPAGDVEPFVGASRVGWTLRDARGDEVARGEAEINGWGGFDVGTRLPTAMNLGQAAFHLHAAGLEGAATRHAIEVQEFRRPEYEVAAALATSGPHMVGGSASVVVSASYYAGGALAGAPVAWSVSTEPTTYTPPNRGEFAFGAGGGWFAPDEDVGRQSHAFASRTDADGRHHLKLEFLRVVPPEPTRVEAEATVTDVNRQAWSARTDLLVHPSALYVGVRVDRPFLAPGQPLGVSLVATDLDGRAVPGRRIAVRFERMRWTRVGGTWRETGVAAGECRPLSEAGPVGCAFEPPGEGGVHRVTASVTDDEGRVNRTSVRVWVAGGLPPPRDVEGQEVTLASDRTEYRAGESAEIMVVAPFAPAEGTLTVRRSGLARVERFRMETPSHTLRVPIGEGDVPNLHLQVDLVGRVAHERGPGSRPAFATGRLELRVPPRERTLAVVVAPGSRELEPGGRTELDVAVHDARGGPVPGAEVAIVAVDEAVLALAGGGLPDPLSVFYADRPDDVETRHAREHVLIGGPPAAAHGIHAAASVADASVSAMPPPPPPPPGGAPAQAKAMAAAEEAGPAPILARADFRALALFAPSVVTDARGRARVALPLPDSLTRYRVVAVAAAGARQFGTGESSVTARLPLMVRPSPPRFLNAGDRFELPVVVQNQTDAPLAVAVAARGSAALAFEGIPGAALTVPARERVEVRLPATAVGPGRARVQVGGTAGTFADAAEIELPVWTPITTRTFALQGTTEDAVVVQPVSRPERSRSDIGGLEITTSSTALQVLTDALLYLAAYPYECSEQIASRVLAVAALRDVLAAFAAEGLPAREDLLLSVERDVARLVALQNGDGSWGFWRRGEPEWPYLTVHVTHALVRAKAKGFAVPEEALGRALGALRDVERRFPRGPGPEARATVGAYALHVRALAGDVDRQAARRLASQGTGEAPLEVLGWLLPLLAGDPASADELAAVRRRLGNAVTETAAAAHFGEPARAGDHLVLRSSHRADAVILEGLLATEPRSPLVPKLVEGLLGHRRAGRWRNTQENVFVLLALDRYFAAYEAREPDFVARAWVGPLLAAEHAFRGRSTERRRVEVPMAAVPPEGAEVVLAREGEGRLYYRIALRAASTDLHVPAASEGFTVARRYEAVSGDDVRRQADGTWRIRAGALVRVRVDLVVPAERHHVALVDPLPAGLEAENPDLVTTAQPPPADGGREAAWPRPWWGPWYEHQNRRDERMEAFASLLPAGTYTYTYLARATTPGAFVVPPPRAEEMYHPETSGRGASDRVVVD